MRAHWWITTIYEDAPPVDWPIAALFGLSLILLGVLIVIQPALLAWLVASLLIAGGVFVLIPALAVAWATWRTRPRRIRVRRT
jgi:protein-S-isoprenylcysteine O-methyltransferase Ste14